jgi:uncharacterized protein (DUF2141 family)
MRSTAITPKILAAASLYGSTLVAADAADLTVTVDGVKDGGGYVIAAIYDGERSFLKRPEALASFRIRASQRDVGFSLKNLPPGKYAVGAFHDRNDNGKLDADPSGSPTEVYGFSNDARGAGGPPAFGDAAFELGDQAKAISIRLGY